MSNVGCSYIFAEVINKRLGYLFNSLSIMVIMKYDQITMNLYDISPTIPICYLKNYSNENDKIACSSLDYALGLDHSKKDLISLYRNSHSNCWFDD